MSECSATFFSIWSWYGCLRQRPYNTAKNILINNSIRQLHPPSATHRIRLLHPQSMNVFSLVDANLFGFLLPTLQFMWYKAFFIMIVSAMFFSLSRHFLNTRQALSGTRGWFFRTIPTPLQMAFGLYKFTSVVSRMSLEPNELSLECWNMNVLVIMSMVWVPLLSRSWKNMKITKNFIEGGEEMWKKNASTAAHER